MSKFTPGKWEYTEYFPEGIILNGTEYLIFSGDKDVALTKTEADARLITFAPAMHALLKTLSYRTSGMTEYEVNSIRELLARIDGAADVTTKESEP